MKILLQQTMINFVYKKLISSRWISAGNMLFQALLINQHLQCRSNHGGKSKHKQFFLSLHRLEVTERSVGEIVNITTPKSWGKLEWIACKSLPVKGIPSFCEIPTHKVIIKFVNVHAGMDKYSQNIFKDRGTSHIYSQTDLSQQNQLQCQWSHSTSK